MISPIKISGKIIGWENGGLVRIGRQPHTSQTQNRIFKLRRRQIGEPSHAVNRRRVQALMAPSAAQVSLEYIEPVIMLLLGSVRLPEPALELQKVMIRSQPGAVHHLPNQRLLIAVRRGRHRYDNGEDGEEEKSPIHVENLRAEKTTTAKTSLLVLLRPRHMEGRLAEELYAESLQLSKLELTSTSAGDKENKSNDCDDDDLSLWDGSDDKLESSSDLDREWQRRHDQFHTFYNIGYRDGLIAGKEASAQEGFNIGFKQSILAGYSWGVVRGVTSALSHLPHQLKERLIETQEKRNKFQGLYESVHSLSTTDALKLFSEEIKEQETLEQSEQSDVSHHTAGLQEQPSHCSQLRNYRGQLESLVRDSPAIDIHLLEPK
ncbi:hypothetical protein CR513_15370, partial [Mucuna pruriens]